MWPAVFSVEVLQGMLQYVAVCVALRVAVQDILQRDLDPDAFLISCGLLPSK